MVLLLYLFTIVVLLNIMVAQLSDSYQNLQRRIHLNRLFLIVEYERQYPVSLSMYFLEKLTLLCRACCMNIIGDE